MIETVPIDNFEKVDAFVWCGARPDSIGSQWLVDQGVKTVINLEWEESDSENFAGFPNMQLLRMPDIEALVLIAPLEDRHVNQVLDVLRRCEKPAYVHCHAGQNRTRVVIGAYQLVVLKLSLKEVTDDLVKHGGVWESSDTYYLTRLAKENP